MKNLLGRLMSRPFDELKVISITWGTLTRDPNPTQNDLAVAAYHTMVDPSAVRGVWENLDPEARAFIVWLLNQRNMLALVDELSANLDRPPEEVGTLLERSRRAGVVDVDEVLVRGSRVVSSGDNLYAWAARNQPEAVRRRVVSIATELAKVLREVIEEAKQPALFEESFADLIGKLDQDDVQKIALTWKLPEAARYYKSELIGVMGEFLATEQGRDLVLKSLPQLSQNVYAYLEEEGGKATAAQVRNHFRWDERELRGAILPLVQRALIWDRLSGDRRYLFIAHDLLNGTQEGTPKIAAFMQPKLDAAAPHTIESRLSYEMEWDLLTLLATAAQGELSLTLQNSRITKRLAKKINDAFLHPGDMKTDTDYIDMVVHVARSLGLLAEKPGEQPALVLTNKAEDWSKLSFDAQRRRIFGLWEEDRKWAEPATYGTIYWWNSDLTAARKRLVKHLLDLPTMQWINLDAFLRKIHSAEPFLIWSQDELVKRFGLRALQGFRSHWFEIEGRIIADMIKTMLFWLGTVELGRDKPKRFVSFRVSEEGKDLFNTEVSLRSGESQRTGQGALEKSLLVQPNFEVLVLHPDSSVIWTLLRMAELVRHDRVSVYTLSKESILRAVEGGLSPVQMTRFLDSNTGKALPQNVAHSITDWASLIKNVDIRRATLIEVEDPSVLDEMIASRKTRRYINRRLSPTVAVACLPAVADSARDDAWQKLLKELKGGGYFPRYVNEAADVSAHSSEEPDKSDTDKTPNSARAAASHSATFRASRPDRKAGVRSAAKKTEAS